MDLYSPGLIKNSFINKYSEDEDLKKKITDFFGPKSIIENAGIKNFFTHQSTNTIFISKDSLSQLCLAASIRFRKEFNFNDQNLKPLNKIYSFPDKECGGFTVLDYSDYMNNFIEHSRNSHATLESIKKKEKNKLEKEAFFKKMADMNHDFLSKTIVSIDFEFDKKSSEGKVKEFGISIYKNKKIENYHFLIKRDDNNYKELELSFNFGKSIFINREESNSILQGYIEKSHFLLFHAFHEDMKILNGLGVSIPKSVKVIDTQIFYMNHFSDCDKRELISLSELSKKMNIVGEHYHNSGNDSAYTLKSFLIMNEKYKNKHNKKHMYSKKINR